MADLDGLSNSLIMIIDIILALLNGGVEISEVHMLHSVLSRHPLTWIAYEKILEKENIHIMINLNLTNHIFFKNIHMHTSLDI